MFPKFSKDYDSSDMFFINGYESIPAYRKTEVEFPGDYSKIAGVIRLNRTDSCGYIDNKVINYHTCDAESYFIDMNNRFVYAYFMGAPYDNTLPVMLILEFLKYRAEKFMVVYEDTFFVLEKTPETYSVCEKLDDIYFSIPFLHNVFMKVISEDNYEMIFYKLVEIFSMRYMNRDSRKMNVIDVLLKILKLNIE